MSKNKTASVSDGNINEAKEKGPGIFRRLGRKIAGNIPLLLCFLIPVIVMLLVFIQRGIFPFGERCFLRTDLYHQYAPFFKELNDKIKRGGDIFYSWDIGNGSNFLALFAYYLSSPFNWLMIFCPAKYVIEFITLGIVLKIGLSGFTFGLFLKKHTGRNDYAITMFAVFYALSGYMAAYSWNIMWLDCLFAFPLVILGLEQMIKRDKCLLYCLSLAFCIITNYYIAIMICIGVVLYFIMLMFITPHKRTEEFLDPRTGRPFIRTFYLNYPKKIGQFALYSLIAGGLSCVLLIPAYYALQMSASASSTFPKTFTSYFSILAMLQRHLDNVDVHIGLDHWPNIFCGVAAFIFIPLYVMNKKIRWKEKIGYGLFVLILLASFSMNFLNFIWHGFHYPNSLPCRQSFIYVFLILTMCYKGYMGIKDRSVAQIVGSIAGSIGFVLLAEQMFAEDNKWHFQVYYVSILFLALYGIFIYIYRKKKKAHPVLVILLLLAVLGENFMNTSMTSVTTVNRTDYVKYDSDYTALYNTTKTISDQLFYRCEKLRLRTKNDGSWYQYPSTSVFSSTANKNLSDYYKILGMESATNAYSKTGATLLVDMLFSVKFEFSNITYPDNELRTLRASSGDVKMYENKYSLPVGFMVPSDFETKWYTEGNNPVDTQNNFITASTGLYNLFKYASYSDNDKSESVASFTVDQDGYYYAYVLNSSIDEVNTVIKSKDASRADQSVNHTSLKRRFILDMGYAKKGDTITITSKTEDQNLYFSLYVLDPDVMKEAYEILNSSSLDVTAFTDSTLEGTIDVKEAGLMYTSIAYDEGWKVYVDGEVVTPVMLKKAMLAIPLSEGTHTIKMEYIPQGYSIGLKLTLLSLLILVLITWFRFLYRKYIHVQSAFIEDEEMDGERAAKYLSENAGRYKTAEYNGFDDEDEEDEPEPEKRGGKASQGEPEAPATEEGEDVPFSPEISAEEMQIVKKLEETSAEAEKSDELSSENDKSVVDENDK